MSWRRVRRLSLRVTPSGELAASVPAGTSEGSVREFIHAHRRWAQHALERTSGLAAALPGFEDGERLPLWGEPVTLVVREDDEARRGSRRVETGHLTLVVPPGTTRDERSCLVDAAYKDELARRVGELAPLLEERVGKRASLWRYRRMTSRWGSCNTRTGAITLNVALAELEPRCLEGVMAHELCHLWVPNHGEEFYQLLSAVFPAWREVRRELRAYEGNLRRR